MITMNHLYFIYSPPHTAIWDPRLCSTVPIVFYCPKIGYRYLLNSTEGTQIWKSFMTWFQTEIGCQAARGRKTWSWVWFCFFSCLSQLFFSFPPWRIPNEKSNIITGRLCQEEHRGHRTFADVLEQPILVVLNQKAPQVRCYMVL